MLARRWRVLAQGAIDDLDEMPRGARRLRIEAHIDALAAGIAAIAAWAQPDRERRHQKAVLQGIDRRHILGAFDHDAADDPDMIGRRTHQPHALRHDAVKAGACDQEFPGCGAGGAPANVRKGIGPEIEQAEHVVAIGGIGDTNHHRPTRQIEPGIGIERVAVGCDHPAAAGTQQLAGMDEGIDPAPLRGRIGIDQFAVLIAPRAGRCAHARHLVERQQIEAGLERNRISQSLAGIGHSLGTLRRADRFGCHDLRPPCRARRHRGRAPRRPAAPRRVQTP